MNNNADKKNDLSKKKQAKDTYWSVLSNSSLSISSTPQRSMFPPPETENEHNENNIVVVY